MSGRGGGGGTRTSPGWSLVDVAPENLSRPMGGTQRRQSRGISTHTHSGATPIWLRSEVVGVYPHQGARPTPLRLSLFLVPLVASWCVALRFVRAPSSRGQDEARFCDGVGFARGEGR